MPITDSLQSNKQHAVPQNIMDVEFKLIGDLTMRQFFYLMIFAAIAYATYSLRVPVVLKWPTIVGSILLGLGFAFVPVEDRGLDEWIVNFFRAIYEENQKIWRKEATPPSVFLHENLALVKQELITLAPTTSRRKLEQFLQYQQETQPVDPLDIPEQAYIEKIHAAFMSTEPMQTSVALEEPLVETDFESVESPGTGKEIGALESAGDKDQREQRARESQQKSPQKPQQRKKPKRQQTFKIPPSQSAATPLSPITPDRHSGRKFTNLLSSEGNIVLPIRGERVLKTVEDVEVSRDAEEKAKQLKQFLKQLGQTEGMELPKAKVQEVQKVQEPETNKVLVKETEMVEPQPTNIPNVVTGVVRGPRNRSLSNLLLIIKNAHNDPVRAIKTNALGQFSITNPLPSGHYKVVVDVNNESGYSFDIIDVEAKGQIISPLVFVGKA